MSRTRIYLLETQMEQTYGPFRDRLEGLNEDEYWWEPVAGCWTLRRQPDGRLVEDYLDPEPHPAPFTTLAWRLFHVASAR